MVRLDIENALSDDPKAALGAVRRLLDDDLPWLEQRAVRMARANGYQWARIARLLKRSRQAVTQRFKSIDGTQERIQLTPSTDPQERWNRQIRQHVGDARRATELEAMEESGDVVPW
jgi:hypothetical protein